jgi:regulation of enolase protein 1 (concanavalin A-like superfamily)
VRLTSNGEQLTASYSFDGDTFTPVGRPASLATFTNPRVGPTALSDAAPSVPMASFDWIRFDPDNATGGGGGGGGGNTTVDNFDGSDLGSAWDVVRRNQQLTVAGGTLRIPAAPGDLYGGRNDAANLVTRAAPAGPWTATTKVNFEGSAAYQQAGIMVYGDDQNFTKFGRIATNAADEKFEFIYENNGVARNDGSGLDRERPGDVPERLLGPDDVGRAPT